METFELRYFLGVAETENIHQASEKLYVSPGSLSKAIARLEEELQVNLFHRQGRGIRLTHEGRLLQKRASEIVRLEESARLELSGVQGKVVVKIAGPEILLSHWGVNLTTELQERYPLMQFEFISCDERMAIQKIENGEVHLAFVTDQEYSKEISYKNVGHTTFKTFVSKKHKLGKKKKIHVDELLLNSFVSPNNPFLGKVGSKQSLDGWRDDEFPRKISFLSSSLKVLEQMVLTGRAVAYLPEYLGESLGFETLLVEGCPYTCTQKVKIATRNPKELTWMDW